MYSALKVNGKKLYELAREGKEIERKGREIEIFDIFDISMRENKVSFTVHCSKGTYIRTLCKDIGEKLGCGAVMSSLERVRAGSFKKDTAVKLSDLENAPDEYIIDLETVLEKFPIIYLDEKEATKYKNGIRIYKENYSDGIYRVYIDEKLYGTCTIIEGTVKNGKKIMV